MQLDSTNHWSVRPWIAEEALDTLTIYTDAGIELFTLQRRTIDTQKLAIHIIELHNAHLARNGKGDA